MKIKTEVNYMIFDKIVFENIKVNKIAFIISLSAFLCLNMDVNFVFVLSFLIAVASWSFFVFKDNYLSKILSNQNIATHIISLLTAAGICWQSQLNFSQYRRYLNQLLPTDVNFVKLIGVLGSIVALYFVYVLLVIIYAEIIPILKDIFDDITKIEFILYGILILSTIIAMAVIFSKTNAFYGSRYNYDVIYTSDSAAIVKGNSYLYLNNAENDIRQPLFMVFAAPFMGIPYIIGKLLGNTLTSQAILMNSMHILMLYVANFTLSKIIDLKGVKRICFMILCSATYMNMLFTLMMEQYIVAYFWLIIFIYSVYKQKYCKGLPMYAAGGTLLTSMFFLPFVSQNHMIKNFKEWFKDTFLSGVKFLAAILLLGRFDVIYNLFDSVSHLKNYTGENIILADKLNLYTTFVANCFTAQKPEKMKVYYLMDTYIQDMAWRSAVASNISTIGLIIIIIACISLIINRKKNSIIAGGWILFSVLMLIVLGWGMVENGLVLYTLYFGWAFLMLVFQFVEKIEDKFNIKYIVPAATIAGLIYMLSINIPSIMEMVCFAIEYYPV